jgi:hypothetical protein
VIDELVSLKAMQYDDENYTVSLLSRGLVPDEDESMILEMIGEDSSTFFGTLEHNLHAPSGRKWFQKKVSYGDLSKDALRELRVKQGREAQQLLESFNGTLKDLQDESEKERGPKTRGGWGVYYFEDGPS